MHLVRRTSVAHRLSTILAADRVAMLEAGRIVQTGPPGALMASDGPFARLVATQVATADD